MDGQRPSAARSPVMDGHRHPRFKRRRRGVAVEETPGMNGRRASAFTHQHRNVAVLKPPGMNGLRNPRFGRRPLMTAMG
jgi:hypothetical protein